MTSIPAIANELVEALGLPKFGMTKRVFINKALAWTASFDEETVIATLAKVKNSALALASEDIELQPLLRAKDEAALSYFDEALSSIMDAEDRHLRRT